MTMKNLMQRALFDAVGRHGTRAWLLVGLASSFGIGVVAACGSDSDGGGGAESVNDAGADRGLIISPPPAHVPVAIAAGGSQACAIMDDGRLLCWGANDYGQLGNPPVTEFEDGGFEFDNQPVPTPMTASLTGVSKVAPGSLSDEDGQRAMAACAVLSDAQVQCWGQDRFGVLGRGGEADTDDRRPRTKAMPVTNLGPSEQVVTNGMTTCAVSGRRAQCWGRNQYWVHDGGGSSPTEVPIQAEDHVKQVALGVVHGIALTETGSVFGWGNNGRGQLGEHTGYISGFSHFVVEIAAAQFTSCVRVATGDVECMGDNTSGMLGRGPLDAAANSSIPARVQLPTNESAAIQISMGSDHACALLDNGSVWCWGSNFLGGLGSGTSNGATVDPRSSDIPLKVGALPSAAIAVAAGGMFTCALLSDHSVMCWGGNRRGMLGQGTINETPQITPVRVPL